MTKQHNILLLAGLLSIYILLQFIPYGRYILYPVNLIVTFLHEFGHSFFAYITGGHVQSIQVNANGSGLAMTSGGIRSIVLMGGYIGSAIFGNILLYISVKGSDELSKSTVYLLAGIMILSAIFLFSGVISSVLLLLIGAGLIYTARKFSYSKVLLGFLGLASLAHIILDFRVGPSSDLSKFSDIFIFIPQFIWMYVWLFIVLGLLIWNLRLILRKG